MADDWVKIRTDIYRDPKVCIMADLLSKDGGPLACYVAQMRGRDMCVTRNVTRNVTVGALVTVWGVTRHRGKRDGDDLVIRSATLNLIDDIADLPGLGDAMAAVGWAIECEEGLVFPRFFAEFNSDPSVSAKEKNAERQRRFREKSNALRNVTRDVTVTSQSNAREEKRREEIKEREREAAQVDELTESTEQQIPQLLTPAEIARQQAAEHVAAWRMPTNAQEPRHRQALVMWQAVRKERHGRYLPENQWESAAMQRASWDSDRWHEALLTSAVDGTLNLATHQDDKRAKSERNGNARYHKARLAHPSDNEIPF